MQQMSWPARTTLPGLAYDVSDLQQRTPDLQVGMLTKANSILRTAKGMVERDVKVHFPAGDGDLSNLGVLCVHDASFDRQPRSGSQMGFVIMVTDKKFSGKPIHIVEWNSSKIHRVVKSTLAAEAASASFAHDRACYVRTAIAEMIHGWNPDWMQLLNEIPGRNVTDCKSFVDLCRKEGSIPTERRIALDVADLRERLESGDELVWTDTRLMLADPLTKHLPDQSLFEFTLKTASYIY